MITLVLKLIKLPTSICTVKHLSVVTVLFLSLLSISSSAQIVWNGLNITFSHPAGTSPADQITTNVWLKRDGIRGLYNSKSETAYVTNVSPAGTEWAYGTLANYSTLTYAPWQIWNANNPPGMVNRDAVLHLIAENIYIGIKFTLWENPRQGGDGGFSYIRSTATALPVNLKHFSAGLKGKNVVLEWKTASELNNKYFDVEHSLDGSTFKAIGRVAGNGSSMLERSYSYTHLNISDVKNYYRLAQYDLNGAVKYSQIVRLSSSPAGKLQVKPNPATTVISITAATAIAGSNYIIRSSVGHIVKKGILNMQQIDVQQLPAGQYFLSIDIAGETLQTPFIKK